MNQPRNSGTTKQEELSSGSVVLDRYDAHDTFARVLYVAHEEVKRTKKELYFSAMAAGLAITITFLAYASLSYSTDFAPIISQLLYPLGFLYIIIGNYQLYTENTLPPVALVLKRRTSLPRLLSVWGIVLAGNFSGALMGATGLALTGVMSPEVFTAATTISLKGYSTPAIDLFFKAIFAGLIVAGLVWVDYATQDTTSRIIMIYFAFLTIPIAGLFHVVVSFTEVMFLVLSGQALLLSGLLGFVLPVLLGNTIGGVLLVTVVNYFQAGENIDPIEGPQLTWSEWLFGGGKEIHTVLELDSITQADEGEIEELKEALN